MWHVWEMGDMHTEFWWGNVRDGRFDSPKYKQKFGEMKRN